MTRLNWNAIGERFFENGVDQGVLYIAGDGYAWSGLISVSESPSGGEARPYYLDGIKYLNLAAAEEFEATINAFSSPAEFAACTGMKLIHNGLFATQQRRTPFGFSYRTMVGNDLDQNYSYKIHLVYNALAAPSEQANNTMSDSPEPNTFSWSVSTLAPIATGIKPTAHFIIDSKNTPGELLVDVEDILYGTDAAAARMPTAQELVDMFNA